MKSTFLLLAALSAVFCANAQTVTVKNLENRDAMVKQGSSWGVPFAKGSVKKEQTFVLKDINGNTVDSQTWPLAWWGDGSIKWLGVATIADEGLDNLKLDILPAGRKAPVSQEQGILTMTPEGIMADTGVMTCLFPSSGGSIITGMKTGDRLISSNARLVAVLEKNNANGVTDEPFESKVEKVSILQNTAMRAAVKIEGKHKSTVGAREWLPFAVYCVMYKGLPTISLTHSFVYDSDGQEDFIKGLGVQFDVPFRDEVHNRHARLGGEGVDGSGFWCQPVLLAPGYRPSAGRVFSNVYQDYLKGAKLPDMAELKESEKAAMLTCPVWGDMRLTQKNSSGFSIDKRTTSKSSWVHVTEGGRSIGGALLGDTGGSIFVGVKDFWQSYPAALYIDHAEEECGALTAWLWSPDAEPVDMRHYDTTGHDLKINYEDYKEGWESPYGVGHRSTIEIRLFDCIPDNELLWKVAKAVQKPVQYACTPEYYYSVKAFGDFWGLPDYENPVFASVEKQIDNTLDFYKNQIEQRKWYGFWNYGDVMHNYDFTRHDWRYDIGGWAWNNVELAPNVLLWTSFLRTGREDIWVMAEALEKHASEVDVHHIGRFAPLGSRHNVTHWGDGCKQPRIEYAAMKRFLYYLTGGDYLTGDLMTEQISSDKAYEYARRVSTWGAVSGTYLKGSLNDWAYYASNWMVEWERTGNTYYRDRLLNSMKDIVALGKKSGRLVFDYYDPETGRFMVYLKEDPAFKGTVDAPESDFVPASSLSAKKIEKIVGYRLGNVRGDTFSTLFGAPEVMSDMKATVDYPEFWALTDNSFRDVSHSGGGNMTGPRMAAWVSHSQNDAEMGALAWKNLLDNGITETESDGTKVLDHVHEPGEKVSTRNIVNPVEEPMFLGRTAGWQLHTPSTVQWMLNAIETMEWSRAYAPSK